MSFQGDVGGIGLSQLMQGLTGGGREGVLVLTRGDGLECHIGIETNLFHLLPAPGEDPSYWYDRASQAYSRVRIDLGHEQVTRIALADRTEILFRMLDTEGVHFKFTPGPVPRVGEGETPEGQVLCRPAPPEAVLLEYARLEDEIKCSGLFTDLPDKLVPIRLAAEGADEECTRLLNETDCASSITEIADRLAWPSRQVKLIMSREAAAGHVRAAVPGELLLLMQQELEYDNIPRALERLSFWIEFGPAGMQTPQDAQILAMEWHAGRLAMLFQSLELNQLRTLGRRIDWAVQSPVDSVNRWGQISHLHRLDPISELRLLVAQIRNVADETEPGFREVMRMARFLRDNQHPKLSGALFMVATDHLPPETSACLELGMGLLEAGRFESAAPFLLQAAGEHLDERQPEKAMAPLRAILALDPKHPEARALFSRARTDRVKKRFTLRNLAIGGTVAVALSAAAVVRTVNKQKVARQLAEIHSSLESPRQALNLLQGYFPGANRDDVRVLRAEIEDRIRGLEAEERSAWMELYQEALRECNVGDPVAGLTNALALPPPPRLIYDKTRFPTLSDVMDGLRARLENALASLGPIEDLPEQVNDEQRFGSLLTALQTTTSVIEDQPEVELLDQALNTLASELRDREESRASMRAQRKEQDNLAEQDILLNAARANAEAGDYPRAIVFYEQLLQRDTTGKLEDLLRRETADVQASQKAIEKAIGLAQGGNHERAAEVLRDSVEHFETVLLPWSFDTFPSGARVTFDDGSERVTPFESSSALDERLQVLIMREGSDPQELVFDGPANRFINLSRTPDRSYKSGSPVEALPLAHGAGHLVANRSGSLVKLSAEKAIWSVSLPGLSGVARAPVYLPGSSDRVLVITEEGNVWQIDAANGKAEGPFAMHSPPNYGPIGGPEGVIAHFADGRRCTWTSGKLTPDSQDAPPERGESGDPRPWGQTAGMEVLRRIAGSGSGLESPWAPWSIQIQDEFFSVECSAEGQTGFTVARRGEWHYAAFEPPGVGFPGGRLWLSDGYGLRGFDLAAGK